MDEELKQAILAMLQSQKDAQEAEARKAADEAQAAQMANFVTVDSLKGLLEEFASKMSTDLQAKIDAAVPVRAEGAGRAGEEAEAQKAHDPVEVIKGLVNTPPDKLTPDQKRMKAEMFTHELGKGLKRA